MVTEKVAEVDPAGIVIEAGTEALAEDAESAKVTSDFWAGLTVIVAVEVIPPNTAVGFSASDIWKGTTGAATSALPSTQKIAELSGVKPKGA